MLIKCLGEKNSFSQIEVQDSSKKLQFVENWIYWQKSYKRVKKEGRAENRELHLSLSGKEVPKIEEYLEIDEHKHNSFQDS